MEKLGSAPLMPLSGSPRCLLCRYRHPGRPSRLSFPVNPSPSFTSAKDQPGNAISTLHVCQNSRTGIRANILGTPDTNDRLTSLLWGMSQPASMTSSARFRCLSFGHDAWPWCLRQRPVVLLWRYISRATSPVVSPLPRHFHGYHHRYYIYYSDTP